MQDQHATTEAAPDSAKGCRLPLGRPGKGRQHLHRLVLGFRRTLERAVAEQHGGEVGPAEASRIRTACSAMRAAARIERILADSGEPGQTTIATTSKTDGSATAATTKQVGLTHAEWLAYHAAQLRAEETRDKAIAALGIKPRDAIDPWAAIYAAPPALLPTLPPAAAVAPAEPEDQLAEITQPERP